MAKIKTSDWIQKATVKEILDMSDSDQDAGKALLAKIALMLEEMLSLKKRKKTEVE